MTLDKNSRRPIRRPGQSVAVPAPVDRSFASGLMTGAELEARQAAEAGAIARPEPAKPRKVTVAISAVLDGWPLVITDAMPAATIPRYLARLAEQGYSPPPIPIALTPNNEPICPRHRAPMTLHEHQGDSWYSHKLIDPATGKECWCKGRPGGDSAGWDL